MKPPVIPNSGQRALDSCTILDSWAYLRATSCNPFRHLVSRTQTLAHPGSKNVLNTIPKGPNTKKTRFAFDENTIFPHKSCETRKKHENIFFFRKDTKPPVGTSAQYGVRAGSRAPRRFFHTSQERPNSQSNSTNRPQSQLLGSRLSAIPAYSRIFSSFLTSQISATSRRNTMPFEFLPSSRCLNSSARFYSRSGIRPLVAINSAPLEISRPKKFTQLHALPFPCYLLFNRNYPKTLREHASNTPKTRGKPTLDTQKHQQNTRKHTRINFPPSEPDARQ
jgi:hypothetical protein